MPFSAMPPLRLDGLLPLLLPLLEPFDAPLPLPVEFAAGIASHKAIAMEYASSPVEQPALQIRSVLGPSSDLRE